MSEEQLVISVCDSEENELVQQRIKHSYLFQKRFPQLNGTYLTMHCQNEIKCFETLFMVITALTSCR